MIGSGFRKDIKKVRQPLQRVVNSISPLKNKDLFSILENAMKSNKFVEFYRKEKATSI